MNEYSCMTLTIPYLNLYFLYIGDSTITLRQWQRNNILCATHLVLGGCISTGILPACPPTLSQWPQPGKPHMDLNYVTNSDPSFSSEADGGLHIWTQTEKLMSLEGIFSFSITALTSLPVCTVTDPGAPLSPSQSNYMAAGLTGERKEANVPVLLRATVGPGIWLEISLTWCGKRGRARTKVHVVPVSTVGAPWTIPWAFGKPTPDRGPGKGHGLGREGWRAMRGKEEESHIKPWLHSQRFLVAAGSFMALHVTSQQFHCSSVSITTEGNSAFYDLVLTIPGSDDQDSSPLSSESAWLPKVQCAIQQHQDHQGAC